jgi:hypothetical protein
LKKLSRRRQQLKLTLHPDAEKNYNQKAQSLIRDLVPDPYANRPHPQNIEPGIFAEEVPQGAIIDLKTDSYMDGYGKEIGKYFNDGRRNIGLFEDGYRNLVLLAESMQNNKVLRDAISSELLKDLIFNWIKVNHSQPSQSSMTEFVLVECENQIKVFEIWIPVSNLLLFGSEVTVGRVTFKTVTREMLDAYLGNAAEMSVEARTGSNRIRSELQGYAAAAMKVIAEPRRAYETVYEESEKALGLLRFYSPVSFDPTRVSYVSILGEQHMDSFHRLEVQNGRITDYVTGLVDLSSPYWQMDQSYIDDLRRSGLDVASDLLMRKDKTDFQQKLLAALLQYSKNCLSRDASDKLVNILVALESVILRDENEPLGKNIGERMAALIGSTVDERKRILSNVAKTYGLRSAFVHHGKRISLDELQTLKDFMMNAWGSLAALIDLHHKNPTLTRDQFFADLEERRLSY